MAAGILLFLAFGLVSEDEPSDGSNRIAVDREALLTFMQYRSKIFQPGRFEEVLDNLPEAELQALVDDYALEEALYREAKALRLDEQDYSLRRGLIRKLEFINQGVISSTIKLSDSELERYMEANEARYYVPAKTTFTHVFFNAETHGEERAEALARAELETLNESSVPFHKAPSHGDRFLYHRNYVNKAADEIASHFGVDLQEQLSHFEADDAVWRGPLRSTYGFHLVMVTKQTQGYVAPFEEMRGRVELDAAQDRLKQEMDRINQAIVDSYDVEIIGDLTTDESSPETVE
jgi:hypothetical protein